MSSTGTTRAAEEDRESVLVVSAHAADFVWRAGGAIALYAERGHAVKVVCLSFGERGESARAWSEGQTLEQIKGLRRSEAVAAAAILGAEIEFFDGGDYPLRPTPEMLDRLVHIYRETAATVVLTHPLADPYNYDHPTAANLTVEARILAQAAGYEAPGPPLGAPPVLFFEPHQPEQCGFRPEVLLNITSVFDRKCAAMEALPAQRHLWEYYRDLARRRGAQLERNAGPNLAKRSASYAEAFMRLYPQVTEHLS